MDLERFWYYTRWTTHANEAAFAAPAPPRRLVRVSPGDVTRFTGALRLNWGLGRVQGGDWDDRTDDDSGVIRENRVYRGLEQRFVDGVAWADTDLYAWAAERFEERDVVRGYESLEAFRNVRLAFLDDLYESIRDDGYRANANADAGHEHADEDNPFEDAYANHLEPLIAIGRDGEVIWTEGYHRFAIADILDLDEIPVLVLCRHAAWQATRDEIHELLGDEGMDRAALPARLQEAVDHPDLEDVLERH